MAVLISLTFDEETPLLIVMPGNGFEEKLIRMGFVYTDSGVWIKPIDDVTEVVDVCRLKGSVKIQGYEMSCSELEKFVRAKLQLFACVNIAELVESKKLVWSEETRRILSAACSKVASAYGEWLNE